MKYLILLIMVFSFVSCKEDISEVKNSDDDLTITMAEKDLIMPVQSSMSHTHNQYKLLDAVKTVKMNKEMKMHEATLHKNKGTFYYHEDLIGKIQENDIIEVVVSYMDTLPKGNIAKQNRQIFSKLLNIEKVKGAGFQFTDELFNDFNISVPRELSEDEYIGARIPFNVNTAWGGRRACSPSTDIVNGKIATITRNNKTYIPMRSYSASSMEHTFTGYLLVDPPTLKKYNDCVAANPATIVETTDWCHDLAPYKDINPFEGWFFRDGVPCDSNGGAICQ